MMNASFTSKAIKDYVLVPNKPQFNIVKGKEYSCFPAMGGYMVRFGTDEVHFPWATFGNYFVEPIKKDW